MSALVTYIQHCTEVLVGVLMQWKEIKYIPIGKNEVIMSVLTNDIIIYVESPEKFTKRLLSQINKFSKVSGYTVNKKNLL